jgi:hypothetical protein
VALSEIGGALLTEFAREKTFGACRQAWEPFSFRPWFGGLPVCAPLD